ncbi:thioredoxin fold domain-containing protein [Thiomicrorhabdus sp. ZW0627]|uniref:thioredoxin fold domain-containing protein n=1 Tax=Thiomicrorhabdus sp. ZW0627 TaxID=3039774 RepID=UPI00243721EB|nr:thioredoxin fold domain-containing protein [Thiomicrorhabdus sp. ZW0627]MDG6773550.1 thioredoxin fold domain-containing protein [Thiomicrorhabdus sp. ZW0627]
MNFLKNMALVCGMALFAVNAVADDKQVIQDQLKKIIPNAPQADIKPSVVPGLYEVSVGPMVIYMTADGKYAFNGSLINLETRENLTDRAKSEARKLAVDKIPTDSMIIFPAKGEQKHYITVFTDIDCPYCHKLHQEVSALNEAGVTVRYLAYPRSGLGSPSYFKAVSVWCAADRTKALDDAMSGKPVANKPCENNPVANHVQQAQYFGVNGTPNIILDNGRLIPGYVPSKELLQILAR